MNVSGKRQARYQMLTIYGLLEVNGDVLLDLQAPKWWNPNTAVVSQLYTLLRFFCCCFFSPPPTVSVLPQQHITAYYACKFRTSKVVIFPVCLSVKPFALICCCVEYDLNIKTLYLDITQWGFFFCLVQNSQLESNEINHVISTIFNLSKVTSLAETIRALLYRSVVMSWVLQPCSDVSVCHVDHLPSNSFPMLCFSS